jgi:hypothetical protein
MKSHKDNAQDEYARAANPTTAAAPSNTKWSTLLTLLAYTISVNAGTILAHKKAGKARDSAVFRTVKDDPMVAPRHKRLEQTMHMAPANLPSPLSPPRVYRISKRCINV